MPAGASTSKRVYTTPAAVIAEKRVKYADKVRSETEIAAEAFNKRYDVRAAEVAALTGKTIVDGTRASEKMLKVWNEMRRIDSRPSITNREMTAMPGNDDFYKALLDLFLDPLAFDVANAQSVFTDQSKTHIDVDMQASDTFARYYLRRLHFQTHDELVLFTENVKRLKPKYAGHLDMLVKRSAGMTSSTRYLHYGGYTIANSPVGREEDDEESEGFSLATTAFQVYTDPEKFNRKVEEYEIHALRFDAKGVKPARDDIRTGFYESLVIDSLGFYCLNVAPPGQFIDMVCNEKYEADMKFLATYVPKVTQASEQYRQTLTHS